MYTQFFKQAEFSFFKQVEFSFSFCLDFQNLFSYRLNKFSHYLNGVYFPKICSRGSRLFGSLEYVSYVFYCESFHTIIDG